MDREASRHSDPHGRRARSPGELPARAWMDIALRVVREISDDRVLLIGAGAACYVIFALVPALASFIALYGLVLDKGSIVAQVSALSGLLAPEVRGILEEQLTRLASEPSRSLGLAFAVTLALSLWSASAGTKAIMDGLNIVYDEEEKRGFVRYNATALAMTLAGLVGGIVTIGVTVLLPVILARVLPSAMGLVQIASYAALVGFVWIALLALYRWGPSRREAEWRWLTTGTIIAVLLLVAFSAAFAWFARTFAGYASYGSLGAVIVFMTWAWMSLVIVLVGGEINAEMEHQTGQDSTVGQEKPRGARGAVMADTIGEPASVGNAESDRPDRNAAEPELEDRRKPRARRSAPPSSRA
jgi:membrane protein